MRFFERTRAAFAQVLTNEHPQVVAIVGSVLDPKVAAKVWDHLDEELKSDAVRRIMTLRSVPNQVMSEVIEAVGKAVAVRWSSVQEVPVKIEQAKQADEVLIRRRLFVFDVQRCWSGSSRSFRLKSSNW